MPLRLLSVPYRTDRVFLRFICVICLSIMPSQAQSVSQSAKTHQATNTATLLVDTDDGCHFFIDDEDKGQVTADSAQKFIVNLGEHILKCKNDTIPDLVWRKVLDVKDTSQVVAMVSLKSLHIQYDQAVTKTQNQKAEAEAAATKQLAEAEAAQKEQATAEAEFPKQLFEIVKGTWGYSSVVGSTTAVESTLTFKDLDSSRGVLTFSLENMARTFIGKKSIIIGRRFSGYFTPSPPNRLEGTFLECSQTEKKSATKGDVSYIPCSPTDNRFSYVILVLTRDQLKVLSGNQELLLARKSQ